MDTLSTATGPGPSAATAPRHPARSDRETLIRFNEALEREARPARQGLHPWAAGLSETDRKAPERRLCRFDRTRFDALGREIRRRLEDPEAPPCGRRAICPA